MRKIIIILFSLLSLFSVKGATNDEIIYYKSDFNNPTASQPLCGWSCFGSGNAAADTELGLSGASIREYFPEDSQPYVLLSFKGLGNAPWSNSTFEVGGSADEWLVSPEIDLSGSPTDVMLDFEVLSYGSTNECKFEVYVSTTGNTRDDFSGKPIYSGRQKGSTRQVVTSSIHRALKGVGGNKIWLAFVNKSTDAQLTGFNNIRVSEYDIDLINLTPSFTTTAGSYEVAIQVSIMTPVSARGFMARLEEVGGGSQEYSIDTQLQTRYSTYTFSFPEPLQIKYGETKDYLVTVIPAYDNATPTVMHCTLVCREGYPATCVMEEGTGSWCGYCVRGTAAMNYYSDTLGDRFIGIAVHSDDPMECYDYLSAWSEQSGLNSYPSSWINRARGMDPAMGAEYVLSQANRNVGQQISIDSMSFNPDTYEAKMEYSVEYCYDILNADISVCAVVTEDDCIGEGGGWGQNNYYSGCDLDQWLSEGMPEDMWDYMYEYAEAASYIPSQQIPFNHVAKGIFPNYYGDSSILPAEWKENESQKFTILFKFPTIEEEGMMGIQDWEKTAVSLLLLDRVTGNILNANQIKAIDYNTGSSVEKLDSTQIKISANKGSLTVEANPGSFVEVVGVDGFVKQLHTMESCKENIQVSVKGVAIVKVTDGSNMKVSKLIF